jgi:hypothetical protein
MNGDARRNSRAAQVEGIPAKLKQRLEKAGATTVQAASARQFEFEEEVLCRRTRTLRKVVSDRRSSMAPDRALRLSVNEPFGFALGALVQR